MELTVLRGIENNAVIAAFFAYKKTNGAADRAEFLSRLYAAGGEENFTAFVQSVILLDENAFSVACACGKKPSDYVEQAFKRDLQHVFSEVLNTDGQGDYCVGKLSEPFCEDFDLCVRRLKEFYAARGYGEFIFNPAFAFADGKLAPLKGVDTITLDDLKNYGTEKKLIEGNVVNFLQGLPYSHILLYGDMGTGKSSTVHAILNKYFGAGLRIIEINKENVLNIPEVKRLVPENCLKFIIFIDDLSLSEDDDKISPLKAILEGSVGGNRSNVMICATSNRRHVIKESFSERENSVHTSDSLQEQLSLADRFGLTVMFSSTDKENYLSIVEQLARDFKLKIGKNELFALAERWAIEKGGRSPRRARQLIDLIYASEVKGEAVEF